MSLDGLVPQEFKDKVEIEIAEARSRVREMDVEDGLIFEELKKEPRKNSRRLEEDRVGQRWTSLTGLLMW